MKEPNEEELSILIGKLIEGQMKYFDRFYELTKTRIFYNIYAIVQDFQLSEDVLQETFLRFLNSLPTLDPASSPIGYLYVISRNLALSTVKKRRKETAIEDYENSVAFSESQTPPSNLLDRAKKLLNAKEFQIVVLHVVNGLSHKEIAHYQKRPLGTITWAYNNAIKKLRKGLGENYG